MKPLEWKTEQRMVDALLPLENNPRKITEEKKSKLMRSLEKFNLAEIPCINTDGVIIGGNQRVKLLQMAGRGSEFIDVRVPNRKLSEAEVKEYALISNTHAGEFDLDLLDEFFGDIDMDEIGIDIPDYRLPDPVVPLEAQEDDYEIPDEIQTDIVVGDVFDIGRHRLMCGDSTNIQHIEILMGGAKADMVFTDPPYGISKEGIQNDNLKDREFYQFSSDYISIAPIKDNCGMVCYHSTRTFYHTLNAFVDNGWKFEKILFFYRPDKMPVHTWNSWMMTSQAILLFSKGTPMYLKKSPADQDVYRITSSDLSDKTVKHPTVKPIKNIADLLNHYDAELIYEPFLGSGSTMIACHQLNRKCYGLELDPKYCQVIIDRMKRLDPDIIIKRNNEIQKN